MPGIMASLVAINEADQLMSLLYLFAERHLGGGRHDARLAEPHRSPRAFRRSPAGRPLPVHSRKCLFPTNDFGVRILPPHPGSVSSQPSSAALPIPTRFGNVTSSLCFNEVMLIGLRAGCLVSDIVGGTQTPQRLDTGAACLGQRIPPQVLGSPDGGRRSSEGPSSPMSQKTKEAAAHASKQLDELMASLQQLKSVDHYVQFDVLGIGYSAVGLLQFQQQPSSDRSLSTRQRHVPSPSSQRGPLYQNASAFVEQPAVEVNSPRHQTSTDVSSSSAFPHSPNGSGAPARQTNGNSILSQSEYRGSLCQKCCQPVIGKVITALGGVWHPEHFTCAYCQKNVVHEFFYEHEGAPYCTECHLSLFAPKCAFCGEAIVDRCLETMGYFWHPEHFFCQGCHTPFVENATAHEHHGKVFCPDCYYSRCSERCGGCGRPIIDTYITALEQPWHEECFKCKDCGMNLTGQNFCTEGGSLYCEKHHRRNSGMICTACQEPITGSRCINALGKRYHPQHFVCTYCLRQLSTGTFKERLGKPYCDPCFRQLFG
ncbi:unnamed protein product [Mesocestoides corti]|uniref:LIM zinc-binding domain-containing protein n=1 Tax=Mesocestoides corti TaxID=53468 RepID=A0A0R3UJS3_MESCO|nr:unnamed protein product [Mesocestoides corti]